MSKEQSNNSDALLEEFWRVSETGNLAELESLLERGVEIDSSNKEGMTALMRAAAQGRPRMVQVLLKHGADPNRTRHDKLTPLMLAAFFGHEEVVRILVDHGAQTSATTRFGTSAQMWANARTFKNVAQYLGKPETPKPRPKPRPISAVTQQIKVRNEKIAQYLEKLVTRKPAPVSAVTQQIEVRNEEAVETNEPRVPRYVSHRRRLSSLLRILKRPKVVYTSASMFLAVSIVAAVIMLQDPQPTTRKVDSSVSSTQEPFLVNKPASRRPPKSLPTDPVVEKVAEPPITKDVRIEDNKPNISPTRSEKSSVAVSRSVIAESPERSARAQASDAPVRTNPALPRVTTGKAGTLASATAPTATAPPQVVPKPVSIKTPATLPTQMISPSKGEPRKGKVIQWP